MAWIDQASCDSCCVCVRLCPQGAISTQETGKAKIDLGRCTPECQQCITQCSLGAAKHDNRASNVEFDALHYPVGACCKSN